MDKGEEGCPGSTGGDEMHKYTYDKISWTKTWPLHYQLLCANTVTYLLTYLLARPCNLNIRTIIVSFLLLIVNLCCQQTIRLQNNKLDYLQHWHASIMLLKRLLSHRCWMLTQYKISALCWHGRTDLMYIRWKLNSTVLPYKSTGGVLISQLLALKP